MFVSCAAASGGGRNDIFVFCLVDTGWLSERGKVRDKRSAVRTRPSLPGAWDLEKFRLSSLPLGALTDFVVFWFVHLWMVIRGSRRPLVVSTV